MAAVGGERDPSFSSFPVWVVDPGKLGKTENAHWGTSLGSEGVLVVMHILSLSLPKPFTLC